MSDLIVERRGALGSGWLAALLTTVVVGLGVFASVTAYDQFKPAPPVVAEPAQLADEAARAEVMSTAAEVSQLMLTYHFDTFEDDFARATERLTPAFREEYDSAMKQVRDNSAKDLISQEATAVSSAIVSATEVEARVLVFVNQRTTSEDTKGSHVVRNRLVVDLVRDDGNWAVAGANALD